MMRLRSLLNRRGSRGFTLVELLVSLIIGTLIAGGVMGLISVSLQYQHRMKEKSGIQPILESAAEVILADPRQIEKGSVPLGEVPGSPTVEVLAVPVNLPNANRFGAPDRGQLTRVMLVFAGHRLELSVIIPPPESDKNAIEKQ